MNYGYLLFKFLAKGNVVQVEIFVFIETDNKYVYVLRYRSSVL